MAVRKVRVYPDPALRAENTNVELFDEDLQVLLADMWETMYIADGVGLAAPQIGVNKNIVVIDYHGEKYTLLNPEIIEASGEVVNEEGCLSFPGIYESVSSPEKIRVKYLDEKGTAHDEEIEGFLACVFSHEIDHLRGRLLIDRVSPLKRQFMKKKLAKRAKEEIL